MEKQNQIQLSEDKQQKLSNIIHKVGTNLPEIEKTCELSKRSFFDFNFLIPKIKERQKEKGFTNLIGIVLVKSCALAGIKEKIDNFTKQDILKLVLTKFSTLTIEEIYKAFELERFGSYETKTEHYQLFNAVYVSDILKKYCEWKTNQKIELNYQNPKIEEKKVISENEKREIVKNGVERVFSEFKNENKIEDNLEYIFDFLVYEKLIKSDLKEEPNLAKYFMTKIEIAKNELIAEEREKINILEPSKSAETFKKIREGISPAINIRAKKLVLIDFFNKQIELGKQKIFES